MQMPTLKLKDILDLLSGGILMEKIVHEMRDVNEIEAIDEYFECTSFCSIEENISDCQTICMERFLKGNYF